LATQAHLPIIAHGEGQASAVEGEETEANNISSPIYSNEAENPNASASQCPTKTSTPIAPVHSDSLLEGDQPKPSMANFMVNPAPYVSDGFEVED
jgi:hypothetical protein